LCVCASRLPAQRTAEHVFSRQVETRAMQRNRPPTTRTQLEKGSRRARLATDRRRSAAMNHRRRRPKNRRAGCLMCMAHKANGYCRRIRP
jgi:hypothetical protein